MKYNPYDKSKVVENKDSEITSIKETLELVREDNKLLQRLGQGYREEIWRLRKDLAEYQRLEKEGLLVKFPPLEVGNIIYEVDAPEYGVIFCEITRIYHMKGWICGVKSNGKCEGTSIDVAVVEGHGKGSAYQFDTTDFGKLIFFTQAEAEEALKGSIL